MLGECPRKFHFHGSFFPAAEFGVPCFYTRLSLRWYSELHAYMWCVQAQCATGAAAAPG